MKAVDMESGKVTRWQTDAHEAPINCILPLSSGLVASGDDDGCVRLWDGRQSDAVAEFTTHTDCVTDFAYQVSARPLASTLPALQHTHVLHQKQLSTQACTCLPACMLVVLCCQ